MTIYEKAAARILVPGQWTQGTNARDPSGRGVSAREPGAVCWCAWGAIIKEGGEGMSSNFIMSFNDAHGRTAEEAALAILLIGVSKDDL